MLKNKIISIVLEFKLDSFLSLKVKLNYFYMYWETNSEINNI